MNWPIEKKGHFALEYGSIFDEDNSKHDVDEINTSRNIFDISNTSRRYLINVLPIQEVNTYKGQSYMTAWLTKSCPIGCDFCFFHSPLVKVGERDNTLTEEGIEKLIDMIQDANVTELMVSGGGEPFIVFEKLLSIIGRAFVDRIVIATGANWSKTKERAEKHLSQIREKKLNNKKNPKITIRLSIDKYHHEKLSNSNDFDYIKNIIIAFKELNLTKDNIWLEFRTIFSDETVTHLINELQPVSISEIDSRKKLLILPDGLHIKLSYSDEFTTNGFVNLQDPQFIETQTKIWDNNINNIYGGNTSVMTNTSPHGLNLEIIHDGTFFPWGATPSDNEFSIYRENYSEMKARLSRDPITITFLEFGNMHRDAVINEVNPKAPIRGKCIGIRDFYPRILFEEEKSRLYYHIRSLQLLVSQKRIHKPALENLPDIIKCFLQAPVDQLRSYYKASTMSIVDQYTRNNKTQLESLKDIYNLVSLGHYDCTVEELVQKISCENALDKDEKNKFLKWQKTKSIPLIGTSR